MYALEPWITKPFRNATSLHVLRRQLVRMTLCSEVVKLGRTQGVALWTVIATSG